MRMYVVEEEKSPKVLIPPFSGTTCRSVGLEWG